MRPEEEVIAPHYALPRLALAHGRGTYVWDVDGRRYLDFSAGLGVLALGHGRPDLARVAARQMARLAHTSNLFAHGPGIALASRLLELSGMARVTFANSGAEAIEAALKFARLVGRARGGAAKHAIIACTGSFHGRTTGALALTHRPAYRAPFAPLLPGVRFIPFDDLPAARAAIDDDVCAVVVEPVQGEGGVRPLAPTTLRGLRALCDAHGALLVVDEIQCGLGRTGTLWAHQQAGVVPDMITVAKALAGGLPLGAVLLGPAAAAPLAPGLHGSTFAGGPVTCAVALRVLEVLTAPAFLAGVRDRGAHLAAKLAALARAVPALFASPRGIGLMQGIDVRPEIATPRAVVAAARACGLLATRAGEATVRLLPPLTCTDAEIDLAIGALAGASAAVLRAR